MYNIQLLKFYYSPLTFKFETRQLFGGEKAKKALVFNKIIPKNTKNEIKTKKASPVVYSSSPVQCLCVRVPSQSGPSKMYWTMTKWRGDLALP